MISRMKFALAPNAVLSMSSTSSSGIDTALITRRKRAGRCAAVRKRRIAQRIDRCARRAVEVVDAVDVQFADALRNEVGIEVEPSDFIEAHDRRRARFHDHRFGIRKTFLRRDERLLRSVGDVEHPDAVQRRRFLDARHRE